MTRILCAIIATLLCILASDVPDPWLMCAYIVGAFGFYLYAIGPVCERGGAWLERTFTNV